MFSRTAWVGALILSIAETPVVTAQTCDPDSFDSSTSGYDDLQEERFESTSFAVGTAFGECHTCESSTLILPGIVLFPEDDTAALILEEDCEASIPIETIFAASYVGRITVVFTGDEDKVGFFYGSRTNDVSVTVETSDGASRTFNMSESPETVDCVSGGFEGFFGYCTGSDSVLVDRMMIDVSEGGIDGLRCTNCAVVPVETVNWSHLKARF